MLIKKLSYGLSGANVELRQSNNELFIRKKAKTASQSQLLRRQAEIMQCWDSKSINIPTIIQTGIDDCDNFFIDMDYIEGDSFSHYIANPNILNSKYQWSFAEMLLLHMRDNMNFKFEGGTHVPLYSQLIEKLDSLNEKLLGSHGDNNIIKNIIIKLSDYTIRHKNIINELNVVPLLNTVHGDLSLSNIIVSADKLYFIDAIDHYLENLFLRLL